MTRQRRYKSKKDELLKKSRESILAAAQIYNNPLITFKSETYITLAIISWTYLLHAYYQKQGIDYCYYKLNNGRKTYDYTKNGAYKHWELERCLNETSSPIDLASSANLRFLIGIRHEIEHQMTTSIDPFIGAKLQASLLNYNYYIKNLFGEKYSLDNELSLSLSLAEIDPNEAKIKKQGMNDNVERFISEFESSLDDSIFKNKHYSYKILYFPISTSSRGQADKVIEFVKLSTEQEDKVKDIVMFKDREKPKFKPKAIVKIMKDEGYNNFTINKHTGIWKELEGKRVDLRRYGTKLSDGSWYWYENWIDQVRTYCEEHYKEK